MLAATDAQIGDRHVEHGLAPAAGGSVRLSAALAPALARYLLLTGDMLSGTEAVEKGLATIAVEPPQLDAEVERIVRRLRSRGRSTLQTIKAMLAHDPTWDTERRLRRELELFLTHVATSPDVRIGLDAFHEGVKATFDHPAERGLGR